MKKIFAVLAVVAIAAVFTSCDKDGGRCKCTYTILGTEVSQEYDMPDDTNCKDFESTLDKYTNVSCKPVN